MKRCRTTICCTSPTLNYRIRSYGCIGSRSSISAGRSTPICSGSNKDRDAFDNIPPEIFASKALLAYGIRTDTFDLVPTVRNYEKLIDNVSHTSYHNNNYYNFDIAVLQTMQHRGALREP